MTADDFESGIVRYIGRHGLLTTDAHVIVALSGGADSVALLTVLTALGYRCTAAHCDFHLRGEESERDRRHASRTARELGVECRVEHFDTTVYAREKGISIEMAARELRYGWFERLRRELDAEAIAVAHHRDDNVETFFLNLLRGTGIAGLTGISPRRDRIIRPFLGVSRADILAYLDARRLTYVTDSSNLSNDYRRNRLRNVVLPMLEREFPGATEAICRTMGCLGDNRRLMDEYVAEQRRRYIDGNAVALANLMKERPDAEALLFELMRPYGFNDTQTRGMLDAADTSGQRFLSPTHLAVTNGGRLQLATRETEYDNDEHVVDLRHSIESPIRLDVREMAYTPGMSLAFGRDTLYLDAEALEGNPQFTLRRWRHGDRLAPFGMNGTRLVSDIFSDAHLSLLDKQRTWLLTRNGTILWIVGLRASRHYPLTPTTRRAIAIEMHSGLKSFANEDKME